MEVLHAVQVQNITIHTGDSKKTIYLEFAKTTSVAFLFFNTESKKGLETLPISAYTKSQ